MKKLLYSLLFAFIALTFVPGASAQEAKLVCIDAGHGANTGAYNATHNLWEDEINLDVSYRLKALLEGNGYTVGMPRTSNVNLSNNDRYTYCNAIGADILVSVHTNSSTNTEIDGTYHLYFKKIDKPLAQSLHNAMYPVLRDDPATQWTFTNFGLSSFASGVLSKSDMPAALTEPVLMSYNPEALLLTDLGPTSRRQLIAQSLFNGIQTYFVNNPGGGTGGGGGGPKCGTPPCRP